MEIITFDHKVYQDLNDKIERIADYVFKKEKNPDREPEIWLTSEELADLLKISTRTLQRMRKERVIPYTMLRSKCLYRLFGYRTMHRQTDRNLQSADARRVSEKLLPHPQTIRLMILDTDTFELWMSKIMERFDRHEQMLSKLAGKEIKEVKYLDGERLLDNQDLCQLLQASKRSLQRYRSSGTLRYQMLWHKIYYKESDVQEFLKNHFDEFRGCRKVEKEKG